MEYYLYILYSECGNRYYKGASINPANRLRYHNSKEKGYTARYRPWKLVFQHQYPSKEAALQAERTVKAWKSRRMIEKLIAGLIEPPD